MERPENSDSSKNHNNLETIYEYTQSILKAVNEDTNTINTKLGTAIAFNGVLIKITADIQDRELLISQFPCYTCLAIKFIVLALLIFSIWISALGLTSNPSGSVVKPGELIDNWYGSDSEVCKLFILKGLRQAVEDLDKERERKSLQLSQSIKLLAVAVTLFALGSLVPAISGIL